jgi:hypothetical protein
MSYRRYPAKPSRYRLPCTSVLLPTNYDHTPKMPPSKRPKTSYNARTKSATTLKKKIRDAERLLQRPISADVRVESERALAAFKHELTIATRARTEQKIAKKYHMVRFFGSPSPPHSRQKCGLTKDRTAKSYTAFKQTPERACDVRGRWGRGSAQKGP